MIQTRFAIAAGLSVALFASGLFLGVKWGQTKGSFREVKLLSNQMDAVLAEQAEDRKRAERLQKTLDGLPKSEGKVRGAVRANPSKCDRPTAVADSVQAAIDKANAARALPRDP